MTIQIGEYGESVLDFGSGDRVELSPHLDLWMRGDRFGNVLPRRTGQTVTMVRVDMDKTGIHYFAPCDLRKL